MILFDSFGDGVDVGLSLRSRYTRLEPSQRIKDSKLPVFRLLGSRTARRCKRHPQFALRVRKLKLRLHNSDDRVASSPKIDALANYACFAAESALPQIMADNSERFAILVGRECSPDGGLTEHRKEFRRGNHAERLLRITAHCQAVLIGSPDRGLVEHLICFFDVAIIRHGQV